MLLRLINCRFYYYHYPTTPIQSNPIHGWIQCLSIFGSDCWRNRMKWHKGSFYSKWNRNITVLAILSYARTKQIPIDTGVCALLRIQAFAKGGGGSPVSCPFLPLPFPSVFLLSPLPLDLGPLSGWLAKCFVCVRWGSTYSCWFQILAGVRQGGILSPILFAVYIDPLITQLSNSGLGCTLHGDFYGCGIRWRCTAADTYSPFNADYVAYLW